MSSRPSRTATVARTERLSPSIVRVHLRGPDVRALSDLPFADHYVKLAFGDVTRTYTIHSVDAAAGTMAIDFVTHGDVGLAGPWAARAEPGDMLTFYGPGGAWAPAADADAHLLVGDESAIPAIVASLERLAATAPDADVRVFLEVGTAAERIPVPTTSRTSITWVERDSLGTAYGEGLVDAVVAAPFPDGVVHAFVHGNADMIKPLRRWLFHVRHVPRERVSISGYWRTGLNEDGWQSSKHEFVAAMEAEQDG